MTLLVRTPHAHQKDHHLQANVTDELLQQIIQKEKLTPLDAQKQLVNKANDIILLAKSVDNIECLQTASRHLTSAISIIKSQQKSVPIPETLKCRKRPASNSCMDKQLRFYSTKKRRSTNSISIAKPSVEKSNHAKDTLVETDVTICSVCLKEEDTELTDTVEWLKCNHCDVWLHVSCILQQILQQLCMSH